MRRVLICFGVLGGGTALTFAAAAVAATMMPNGAVVPASVFGGVVNKGGVIAPVPMPVTEGPIIVEGGDTSVDGADGDGTEPEVANPASTDEP